MPFHTACKCQLSFEIFLVLHDLRCNAISHRLQVPTTRYKREESENFIVAMPFHTACKCQHGVSNSSCGISATLQCHFTPLASANRRAGCPSLHVPTPRCNAISHRLQVPTHLYRWWVSRVYAVRCNAISHRLQVPTTALTTPSAKKGRLQCHFTPLASANSALRMLSQASHRSCNAISHRLQVPTMMAQMPQCPP